MAHANRTCISSGLSYIPMRISSDEANLTRRNHHCDDAAALTGLARLHCRAPLASPTVRLSEAPGNHSVSAKLKRPGAPLKGGIEAVFDPHDLGPLADLIPCGWPGIRIRHRRQCIRPSDRCSQAIGAAETGERGTPLLRLARATLSFSSRDAE